MARGVEYVTVGKRCFRARGGPASARFRYTTYQEFETIHARRAKCGIVSKSGWVSG